MALYNEIQVGRFNRYAQKLLSMKGGPPLPTVSSDLQFGISLFDGAESRNLQGWDLFSLGGSVAAIVGQRSMVQLRNPVGSNVIAVITMAWAGSVLATDGASMYSGALATDSNTILTTSSAWDGRGRTQCTCIASSNTGAPTLSTGVMAQSYSIANRVDFLLQPTEFPLVPGRVFQLADQANNQLMNYGIQWRERYLEDSERS